MEITLLDSVGRVATRKNSIPGKLVTDTLKFWQNPVLITYSGIIDNENPMNTLKVRFWFARDNYVLVTTWDVYGATKTKIDDIDGEKNGGHFETTLVDLTKDDIHCLCTDQSS